MIHVQMMPRTLWFAQFWGTLNHIAFEKIAKDRCAKYVAFGGRICHSVIFLLLPVEIKNHLIGSGVAKRFPGHTFSVLPLADYGRK